MSAYMVEDKTINSIIAYLERNQEDLIYSLRQLGHNVNTFEGKKTLGEAMFKLNIAGVESRYGENEAKEFRPLDYRFKCELPPNAIQAHKSLGCFLYQCSEGNVPEEKLYKDLRTIQDSIGYKIISSLPEYGRATWG